MANQNLNPWSTPPQFVSTGEGGARVSSGAGPALPGGFPGEGGAPPPPSPGFLRTVPQPVSVKPPGIGHDFLEGTQVTGVTSASGPASLATFSMPAGNRGWVRSLILQVNGLLLTSQISFSLQVNNTPVPGLGIIPVFAAVLTVYIQSWGPEEVFVDVAPDTQVQLLATVADAGTYTLGGLMHGWYVPAQVADAFAQGWGA